MGHGSAPTKSMASATQICGPKSCVFESIPNDCGSNTKNNWCKKAWFIFFCLGSGGILRWKKTHKPQKIANLQKWPFCWGDIFKWPVDSKVVKVTSQVWGGYPFGHGLNHLVGLVTIKLSSMVWFVVVKPPRCWFNQIENRLSFKQKNTARKRHLSKWLVQVPGSLYWLNYNRHL